MSDNAAYEAISRAVSDAVLIGVREGLSGQQGTLHSRAALLGESSTANNSFSSPMAASLGESSTASNSFSASFLSSKPDKKRKRSLPSVFEKKKQKKSSSSKKTSFYVRDIVVIPREWGKDHSHVPIPRMEKRKILSDAGLLGKFEFNLDMSADDVSKEICTVFSQPFQLSLSLIERGERFKFKYLQKSGEGTRSLCCPTVKENFEWTGRVVSTLAKSGGCIYLLADETIECLYDNQHLSSDEDSINLPTYKDEIESKSPLQSTLPLSTSTTSVQPADVIVIDSESTSKPSTSSHLPLEDNEPTPQFQAADEPARSQFQIAEEYQPQIQAGSQEDLISMFETKFSQSQISTIYRLFGHDFDAAVECLCVGPTQEMLLKPVKDSFVDGRSHKIHVDSNDIWLDLVGAYKAGNIEFCRPSRILLDKSPAIDTGGVRRQVFNDVFQAFADNKHITLFEGPPRYLRPINSIEIQSTGIMKVLGQMISHSIGQDGVGFPYLSPVCFWYMVGGMDEALPYVTKDDVSHAVHLVVEEIGEINKQEDVNELLSKDYVLDVLQQCVVTTPLTVDTKSQVAQSLLMSDALYQRKPVFDSLAEGLKACGILKLMRNFPSCFVSLFVSTGDLSNDDVCQALYNNQPMEDQDIAIKHLTKFVKNLDQEGLVTFVKHVTGMNFVKKRTIHVTTVPDARGAITAHVCSNSITLPAGVFVSTQESYDLFVQAMMSVLACNSFNTV